MIYQGAVGCVRFGRFWLLSVVSGKDVKKTKPRQLTMYRGYKETQGGLTDSKNWTCRWPFCRRSTGRTWRQVHEAGYDGDPAG